MSADDPTLAAPRAAVRYGNVVVSPAVCAAPERGIWVRRGRGPCRWPTAVFCTRCAEVGAVVRGLADVAFQAPSYARRSGTGRREPRSQREGHAVTAPATQPRPRSQAPPGTATPPMAFSGAGCPRPRTLGALPAMTLLTHPPALSSACSGRRPKGRGAADDLPRRSSAVSPSTPRSNSAWCSAHNASPLATTSGPSWLCQHRTRDPLVSARPSTCALVCPPGVA